MTNRVTVTHGYGQKQKQKQKQKINSNSRLHRSRRKDEDEMSEHMENAIKVMAEHLARKAAKRNDTTSEKYIEGYRDAVIWCAKHPLPPDADLIAALDASVAKLPGAAEPVAKLVGDE